MMKKLLSTCILIFSVFLIHGQITITTTSTSATWSPLLVNNAGATLKWTVTGGGITIPETIINDPTFDLSGNTGSTTITINSDDSFVGLIQLDLHNAGGSEITNLDVTDATALTYLNTRYNELSSLDVSQNTALTNLVIRGNRQFSGQSFDTSNNPQLTFIQADYTGITSFDFSNNTLLTDVQVYDASLNSSVLDQIVIDLDSHGLNNGNLQIAGQTTGDNLTSTSLTAYNNLISKGWSIDVAAPPVISVETITILTTSTSATWSPLLVTNSGATLKWSVSGAGVSIPEIEIDDPTLDLSGNTGTTTITITSSEGFAGLTQLDLHNPGGSQITSLDVSSAPDLTYLNTRYNQLSSLDVSQNTALTNLVIRGNRQFSGQSFDTSNNPQLTFIQADFTGIVSFDFSNNALLTDVQVYDASLTSSIMDQIVLTLDNHGLSNGNLQLTGQTTGEELTSASLVAYNNLIAKGWTIDVPAPAAAAGPEISVIGNGNSIVSGALAQVANGTDFGQVALGSSITKIFTIENIGDSDLVLSLPGFGPNSPFSLTTSPTTPISSGSSTTFEITFTPSSVGVNNNFYLLSHNDLTDGENPFFMNLRGEGIIVPPNPEINVTGNGITIVNGDITPDLADATDFGQETVAISKTNTFTIENTSLTDDLEITSIQKMFGGDAEFVISGLPSLPAIITPGNNITFDIDFTPTSATVFNASIEIISDDTDENPYQFVIRGEGTNVAISNDIMITQYYSGITGSSNKWIEIKNISGAPISGGTYFLALYNDASLPTINSSSPTASVSIPTMATGEVLLFKNAAAAAPGPSNLGSATQISTSVCSFDANDVILISTTNDVTCYANRQDIIGYVTVTSWGSETSFIRGGCASEAPSLDFNILDWIELSTTQDVQVANVNTNIALGTQAIGTTIWNGTSWSNLIPDKTRSVQISGNYLATDGNIDACNLIIDTGVFLNYDGGTTNTVAVENNLTINGTFTIGDTESLVTYNSDPASIIGVITKKESSTPRANQHDVTYWSSPITNGNINTVFSGVTSNRIWLYNQALTTVTDPNDPDIYLPWVVASGPMTRGRGYAAEGPTGTIGVHNIEFTGVPNTGTISREIFVHSDGNRDNDFNLLGNPYPSAIDVQKFFELNGNVDKVVYLWTHAEAISDGTKGDFAFNDYATLNLTGSVTVDGVPMGGTGVGGGPDPTANIGSSQGFMVRGLSSGFANFNNAMRIKNANNQFYKQSNTKNKVDDSKNQQDRIWLNLTSDQGGFNQLLVGFLDKATEGFDDGYDALKIGQDNAVVFYSVLGDEKYAIQGLSPFTEDKLIALGFDANVAPRTFKVSIDHMEGALTNAEIFLVDNLLGKVHDIKQGDYEFEVTEVGENKDRFTLQFKGAVLGVDDIVTKQDFIISNQTGALRINSKQTVKSLKVYDVLGRMLIQQKPNQQVFDINTSSIKNGTVLIIEATLENGASVNRKTIAF